MSINQKCDSVSSENQTKLTKVTLLMLIALLFCNEANSRASKWHLDTAGVETKPGTPWPLPKKWIQKTQILYLVPKEFLLTSNYKKCDVILKAIKRYYDLIFLVKVNGHLTNKLPILKSVKIDVKLKTCGYPQLEDDESYEISISNNTPSYVRAATIWGALKGIETLSQLVYIDPVQTAYAIRETFIRDSPAFSHRGIHVDTARHYIPVKILLQNLDAMAYNKMNVFHWHLSDDESFPLESLRFPELTWHGAYSPLHVYTQREVKYLVKYARLRGIRVVPELDSPGHTKSFAKAFPQLMTPCDAKKWQGQNRKYAGLNPARNETFYFMGNLFFELKQLFQDDFIHLGIDEVPYECWRRNSEIQKFMSQKGFAEMKDVEFYYIKRLFQIVKNLNYKGIVWQDPIDKGFNASKDVIVQVWNGYSESEWGHMMRRVIRKGYKVVFSSCWYFNYMSKPGEEWKEAYRCNPRRMAGTQIDQSFIVGGEVCLWTEYVDATSLLPRLWPRASGTAERLWTNPKYFDIDQVQSRLHEQRCRMLSRGIPTMPVAPGFCGAYDWALP